MLTINLKNSCVIFTYATKFLKENSLSVVLRSE